MSVTADFGSGVATTRTFYTAYFALDITNPEAAKWMEQQITRVIEENQLDFFRLDYNTLQGRGIKIVHDGFVGSCWQSTEPPTPPANADADMHEKIVAAATATARRGPLRVNMSRLPVQRMRSLSTPRWSCAPGR